MAINIDHLKSVLTRMNNVMKNKPSSEETIKNLENQLDNLQTQQWDLDETNKRLKLDLEQAEMQLQGAHCRNVAYNEDRNRESAAWAARLSKADQEMKTMEGNLEHVKKQLAYQEETVKLAKIEMEKLRASKVSDEHLARKLIELVEENRHQREELNLLRVREHEACEIVANRDKEQLNAVTVSDEVFQLRAENQQYKEQTTRLLCEITKYACINAREEFPTVDGFRPCGECLVCKTRVTQNILNQTSDNLRKANEELSTVSMNLGTARKSNVEFLKKCTELENDNSKMVDLINLLINGIHKILGAGVFRRHEVATEVLKSLSGFRIENGLLMDKMLNTMTQIS